MKITTTSLHLQVREELRSRILDGRLVAGGRVNESALATELSVSQTPIREALFGLEQEGLLTKRHGRGFEVTPLTREELVESLTLLGSLEGLALLEAGVPEEGTRKRLVELEARRGESTPAQALMLDRRLHDQLLAGCGNARLLRIVTSVRHGVTRYDHAFRKEVGTGATSAVGHEKILAALRRGDLNAAVVRLEQSWTDALDPMREWLERRRPD